jgi:hypothetical protein
VREDHAVACLDQFDHNVGSVDGVLELFLGCPFLARPDQRVPADRHKHKLGHANPAAAQT